MLIGFKQQQIKNRLKRSNNLQNISGC